jgi:sialate O-acetylesterase
MSAAPAAARGRRRRRQPVQFAARLALALAAEAASAADADDCTPNPCLNGGACSIGRDPTGSQPFTCACAVGFDGVTCEIPVLISFVFSSHMVLQRAPQRAVVFGAANATVPGDSVAVSLSGVGSWLSRADATGAWSVTLPAQAASAAGATLTATSNATGRSVTLEDVLFGDVFACLGQSNTALNVASAFLPYASAAEVEAWAPAYQPVRLLNNGHFWPWYTSRPGGTPVGDEAGNPRGFRTPSGGNGTWHSPGTIANFSASCWFFGADLFDALGRSVPIGLIDNSAGGTSIHYWSSPDAIAQCSQVTPSSNATADGVGALFDAMIAPLAQVALSGVAWFQGESNACGYHAPGAPCGGAYYACALRAMIADWRAKLARPTLPFAVIELCALDNAQWPNMRAAQQAALVGLANATTVPNHDLGDNGDMHSRRKVMLARRQALWMLSAVYGNATLPWSGPVLERAQVNSATGGVAVTLAFSAATSAGLHLNATAQCAAGPQPAGGGCCGASGSPVFLRVANASAADGSGWSWARTAPPTVDAGAGTLQAVLANASEVDLARVRFSFEPYPACALYNGVGGPDGGGDALVAEPFDVALDATGRATPVPVPACVFPCPEPGLPEDCCGPQ